MNNVYAYNEQFNVYHCPDIKPFNYSDGAREELNLLKSLRENQDNSVASPSLRGLQVNWPSLYHLSSQRGNILRPFSKLLRNRKVLEIGAGCGALSRFLGEVGAHVTALEGSLLRASIAAARCRGLDNVKVISDNFQSFSSDEKFDAVTLIGVLEYARLFIKGRDPVLEMLERARSFLKHDGILIVAIENQLGLKYFCGAPEDHTQKFAFGLNDSYGQQSVVTFGRTELEQKLHAAGFPERKLFLPFPDYKLPTCVLFPDGHFINNSWNPSSLVSFSVLFEAQPLPISLFSLEQAWGVVTRNGLLPELSNSFLFCASQKPDLIQSEFSGVLAAHYGTEKFGELAFEEKQFALSLSGEIETRIFRGPVAEFGNQTFTSRPYRPGSLHLEGLLQLINRPGWTVDEIVAWARPWLKELERHASLGRPREVEGCLFETFLPSNFVDAIPQNLALSPTDGAANFFDLDLHFHTDLPLEFVVFRGLFVVIHRVRSCAKPANGTPTHVGEVVIRCMESLGFAVSQVKLQSFLKLFNSFHNLNAGLPLGLNNPLTREISTRQLPVRPI